jgi:ectoine hydroxylase-related dioxygenase (phytanoyl-CoA dioxygenase family)
VFIDLLRHHIALDAVRQTIGENILISNFTANVALPGSQSMKLHADQALVIPPPWQHPWAANVIWCLDDVDEENGATRYLPGSHKYRSFEDVPADAMARTRPFAAPAGSVILMEGRVWHTSGANVSRDRQRRMLFGYYSCDFIRPQANWNAALPPALQNSLDDEMRALFGLGPTGNVRIGGSLTRLAAPA